MKMFQLKMYMAIRGRAPERGSGHIGGSSPPHPGPRLSKEVSVPVLPRIFDREERSASAPPSPAPVLPSYATFEGWDTDQ